jgi:hypothetical protein
MGVNGSEWVSEGVYLKAGRRPKKAMKVRKETDAATMTRLRAKAISGRHSTLATYFVPGRTSTGWYVPCSHTATMEEQ